MHAGIITYQTGHLKTSQLMRKLMGKGHRITLFAFPFTLRPRKEEIGFAERPYQIVDFDVEAFCREHKIRYLKMNGWSDGNAKDLGDPGDLDTPDVFLTVIAKIIPEVFLRGRTILNCHPGLLPENRGLDAFKWCIVNDWPIGNTLHIIDEQIDRGTILARQRVPILPTDNLSDVAERAYEMEVDLQANFDRHLDNIDNGWCVGDDHPLSRTRIPVDIHDQLETLFLEKRKALVDIASDMSIRAHPADLSVEN